MRRLFIIALLPLVAPAGRQAHADDLAGLACAVKISKEAQAIYNAALPGMAPGTNLRDHVAAVTRGLVMYGKIGRDAASPSAISAMKCLSLANG